jgi:hypothetical protein
VSLFSVSLALSGIVGAVFSTTIAFEKDQPITQDLVQSVYGGYFSTLTLWAVVMVGVALIASVAIRKMINAAK